MATGGNLSIDLKTQFFLIAHALQTSSGWIALSDLVPGYKESMTE